MEHRTPGVQRFSGRFTTLGASAPTSFRGDGGAVSAPSTGVYTVTLDRQYSDFVYASAHLDEAAAGSGRAMVTAVDPIAGTITIETQDSIGNPANFTGPQVYWCVEMIGLTT